jgi:hypothetical protein
MADVFLSYRNTPERRLYVERLRVALDAYGLSVWWDYGLEAGKGYEPQIMAELAAAGLVVPIWCAESIRSEWVAKEARYGLENKKLLPARLEAVRPPDPFEPIQAQDLVDWNGAVESFQITALAAAICTHLGKTLTPNADKLRALRALKSLTPISVGTASSSEGQYQVCKFREMIKACKVIGSDEELRRLEAANFPPSDDRVLFIHEKQKRHLLGWLDRLDDQLMMASLELAKVHSPGITLSWLSANIHTFGHGRTVAELVRDLEKVTALVPTTEVVKPRTYAALDAAINPSFDIGQVIREHGPYLKMAEHRGVIEK